MTLNGDTRPPLKVFEFGAHPFLSLTLCIAMSERDCEEPLAFQRKFGADLAQFTLPYPDITT